jgi:hypothetical protein
LKLRASWKYRKSKYPSSCSWKPTLAGPDLYATFFNTANGYGNTAAILRGQIGNTSLKWEVVNQGNVGIDFCVE